MLTNKEIARHLREGASRLSTLNIDDDCVTYSFHLKGLTLRCKANRDAVLSMAKKFEKRQPSYGSVMPRRPTLHRPKFSMVTLRRFTREGDLDGAKAYAKCYDYHYWNHTVYREGTGYFAQYYNEHEKQWETAGLTNSDIVEVTDEH